MLTTRIMYVKIKVTYYQSYDKFKQEDRENEVLEEIDYCIKDVINIKECMTEVCNYFLPVNSLPDDCPFLTGKEISILVLIW